MLFNETGQVLADGQAVGQVSYSRGSETGWVDLESRKYGFRLSGPFGQGYNMTILEPGQDPLGLSYSWRDGTEILEGDVELDLSEDGTTFTRRGELLASVSWTSKFVRVRVTESVSRHRGLIYASLLALDRMYADKTGVFRRDPERA